MTDIGGDWFVNNMYNPKLPINNPRLSRKQQQEEDKLKFKLRVAGNHWKFGNSKFIEKKIGICHAT